jgi:hypothetical protein
VAVSDDELVNVFLLAKNVGRKTMFDNWNGSCHRCSKKTNCHTMSMFNEDLICRECKVAEREKPKYKEAVEADIKQIKSGNFNFKGIGL